MERVRAGLTRLGVDIRIGTNIPAVSGVIGHAILAYLPPAERDRVLATAAPRGQLAALQPMTKAQIMQSIATVRRHRLRPAGFLFGNGLRILAAPVLDCDGHPVAAVSVAAPAIRLTLEEFSDRALAPVCAAAWSKSRAPCRRADRSQRRSSRKNPAEI